MTFTDLVLLGLNNMWRMKLRSALTIIGVVVGIGALSSMVSFGSGIQKNITDAVYSNDLFTSMIITSKAIQPGDMDPQEIMDAASNKGSNDSVSLTDSLLYQIQQIPGVALAFPTIEFPARVRFLGDSATMTIGVLPAGIRQFKPYSELLAGEFFGSDSSTCVIIREDVLASKLKIKLIKDNEQSRPSPGDSLKGIRFANADTLIGQKITLVSMTINPGSMPAVMMGMMGGNSQLPVVEHVTEVVICGILKTGNQFSPTMQRGHLFISPEAAKDIPRMGFSNVMELLNPNKVAGTYASIHARVHDMGQMDSVREVLDTMGVGVYSVSDQLGEIRRQFLILNIALGAIGAIALLVAGLGITNTMIMSILERKREIGIMKAIGGSERQIRMVFFVEASVIGAIGAIFGLILGWIVTWAAGLIINNELFKAGEAPADMFYFSPWLIAGAIAFAMAVSLAAGLYPAIRASRIDPVKALRHD